MLISREVDYGYRIIVYLGLNEGKYIKRKELCEKERIPYRYLKKVLEKLTKNKILRTKSGKNGGYRLNISLKKITFLTILKIIDEEKIKFKECILKQQVCEFRSGYCVVHNKFKAIEREVERKLNEVVFSDLLGK